ncbi:helix-turn-helix domain-containing protein [Corallococcus sp. AS-1-6]|uniref:AlbA family DNA-binding domain-containing protein n=1 Tax=Corallococcus sp. AS-1-6 TaxID=2874599 RepID=UPI001CBA7A06|nr:ATP-binding protein [Corallococcus sp. AS-1-6]MBZ4373280.1 ATP-binding protein [Corallococcus sp. AS-1-6]
MQHVNEEEVARQLLAQIATRGREPVGALFSFVLRHTGKGTIPIEGRIVFSDERVESRAIVKNQKMTLVEEWVEGAEAAVDRVRSIIAGSGTVDSVGIVCLGASTYTETTGKFRHSVTGWREWQFVTRLPRVEGYGEADLPGEPILSKGNPPYLTGAHAVWEWIHRSVDSWKKDATHASYELITVLPDSRVRLSRVVWRGETLEIDVDVRVTEQGYEVQVFYGGGKSRRHDIREAQSGMLVLDVPNDVETIETFVVDRAGEMLVRHSLHRNVDHIPTPGADVAEPSEESQIAAELRDGENEKVEYKPFVDSKDSQKEAELVKTVVAFSNAGGGRLYIGVEDSGQLQGFGELKKISKRSDDAVEPHIKSMADRVDQLIRDGVKPLPKFKVKSRSRDGSPFLVVEVERGDQPPYATKNNDYFVRHGSSSMRPDPSELRRLVRGEYAGFDVLPLLGFR